ncbi:aminodeoxychorismate/anthranilate synthase component II [Methanothermobacter wolfeii]|uniref:anthranilate synthase n=1 Tax=Methanothermobacter wolfeii TaxID=145261 RepID=A0A9E7RU90_METWO|nr:MULTISPECIES: aminodeoxychorismate/anthranilate synthase component II [Methanothermobacter]MDI6702868.1 aminodeoxychorismate/anthranilate synthase component II [Methanothermobacter wolfeii]MDI6841397.1 aminodeoxychorismate/anthranilate synthase component II [Methanothermobacter wolfeii]NLM02696.1 aminodeoxychorismate/anthranilate synthase component II [Methanothermobacter wolfeii]QHN05774.1 aminodeoxychorismate/anthranilate synthase component II [Methanothermobacter sp. THM-1]UXH31921.1 ami
MILIIDNYDSFTHNLYQMVGEILETGDEEIQVFRNDELEISDVEKLDPAKIIISPGPGTPERRDDFGICRDVIRIFHDRPILGVCLGHQGIFSSFGGRIDYGEPVHGKIALITHDGSEIFRGVPSPFRATRYHSITCSDINIPPDLRVTARTDDGIIMAVKHVKHPIYGLQFHPESIGTPSGRKILENFLRM